MGNQHKTISQQNLPLCMHIYTYIYDVNIVNINSFELHNVIGKGGFSKVWRVTCKLNAKQYAMKIMSKVKIIDKHCEQSIMSERNILSKLRHPFLVNMVYSFQDADCLYLILELYTGGDLRYQLTHHHKRFTEYQLKFFISCIVLGLEYIHANRIIHQDIKPENLIFDSNGYLHITDFGIARTYQHDNKLETSGTPGYMAPELLFMLNHKYDVDYYAMGIIMYEIITGKRPYKGKSKHEIKNQIISHQARIGIMDIPQGWNCDIIDFINSLLQKKSNKRLGCNGISEIKSHTWFKGFNWEDVFHKKTNAPFIPLNTNNNYNKPYCEVDDKDNQSTIERYKLYRSDKCNNNVFDNYTWDLYLKEAVNEYCYNNMRQHYRNQRNKKLYRSKSVEKCLNDEDEEDWKEKYKKVMMWKERLSKSVKALPRQINCEFRKRSFNRQQLIEEAEKGNLYISPVFKGFGIGKRKYKGVNTIKLVNVNNGNNNVYTNGNKYRNGNTGNRNKITLPVIQNRKLKLNTQMSYNKLLQISASLSSLMLSRNENGTKSVKNIQTKTIIKKK